MFLSRKLLAFLTLVLSVTLLAGRPGTGQAKEYEIDGIVDCGKESGKRCDIGETIWLMTDDITGLDEKWEIDVSWIQSKLPTIDQDDQIKFQVEDKPGGGIRALGVIERQDPVKKKKRYDEDDVKDNSAGFFASNFSGTCSNRVSGGSVCTVTGSSLDGAQAGGIAIFIAQSKLDNGSVVTEQFPCTPITNGVSTTCNFATTGRLFQGALGILTYPLAAGGTGSTSPQGFNCSQPEGTICPNITS